jgi:hypothetical protein
VPCRWDGQWGCVLARCAFQRDFTAAEPNRTWVTDTARTPPDRARSTAARSRICSITGSSAAAEEGLNQRTWRTRAELHYAIVFWIERIYHR